MSIEHIKTLSLSELYEKRDRLKIYLERVNEEIKNKKSEEKGSSKNTFPLNLFDKEEKPKPKKPIIIKKTILKKTSDKKTTDESPRKINATMETMREVLTSHGIAFKKSSKKDELSKLVRDRNLIRECESIQKKK